MLLLQELLLQQMVQFWMLLLMLHDLGQVIQFLLPKGQHIEQLWLLLQEFIREFSYRGVRSAEDANGAHPERVWCDAHSGCI